MMNNEKAIFAEVKVNADLEDVWDAWTTEKGIKTFFAPACNVDLRPDGLYEVYFNPGSPPGERGGRFTGNVNSANEDVFIHLERTTHSC